MEREQVERIAAAASAANIKGTSWETHEVLIPFAAQAREGHEGVAVCPGDFLVATDALCESALWAVVNNTVPPTAEERLFGMFRSETGLRTGYGTVYGVKEFLKSLDRDELSRIVCRLVMVERGEK